MNIDKTFGLQMKDPGTKAFRLAFENFWKVYPHLKGELIMYMYTAEGTDWFKHKTTREDYKVKEN
jgi:hypothetical protein|tara:strand:+ start:264 stop:458 length:195 start_codon:yes stop_codon:yes gene_type:complete